MLTKKKFSGFLSHMIFSDLGTKKNIMVKKLV